MTREEVDDSNPVALAIWEFENAINGTEADNSEYPNYCIHINEYKTALAALKTCTVEPSKSAQLDETGLVPCGCGGKVDVAFYPGWHGVPDMYQVDCFNCHVGTRPCQTAEQAKAAWNTAMGWKGGAEELGSVKSAQRLTDI